MRWLRSFFSVPDPLVKIAAGLSEPEAEMWRELLENNGVPSMVKNMSFLSVTRQFGSLPGSCDLFVKQSDAERALEILGPMLQPGQRTPSARRQHRHHRE